MVYLKPDHAQSKLDFWFDYIGSKRWCILEIRKFKKEIEDWGQFVNQFKKNHSIIEDIFKKLIIN